MQINMNVNTIIKVFVKDCEGYTKKSIKKQAIEEVHHHEDAEERDIKKQAIEEVHHHEDAADYNMTNLYNLIAVLNRYFYDTDYNIVLEVVAYALYDPNIHTWNNASSADNLPLFKYLLTYGADIYKNEETHLPVYVSRIFYVEYTAHPISLVLLILVAEHEAMNIFRYLYFKVINSEDNLCISTPKGAEHNKCPLCNNFMKAVMISAATYGRLELVKFFIEDEKFDAERSQMYVAAIIFEHLEVVKYLVSKGVDIYQCSLWGLVIDKRWRSVLYLLSIGTYSPQTYNNVFLASLYYEECLDIIKYLINNSYVNVADLNDGIRQTGSIHLSVLKYLVEVHDVDIKYNTYSFGVAIQRKQLDTVKYYIQHDIYLHDEFVVECIHKCKDPDILDILNSVGYAKKI